MNGGLESVRCLCGDETSRAKEDGKTSHENDPALFIPKKKWK